VGLRLASEALPAKGAEIRGAKGPIGQLTSSVFSPELGAIALGFVKADAAQPGADVQVAGGAAQIVELPMRSGG
jgi:glycine cleavage system aminomethyltransferase T